MEQLKEKAVTEHTETRVIMISIFFLFERTLWCQKKYYNKLFLYNSKYYRKSLATMHVYFFCRINLLLQLVFLASVPVSVAGLIGHIMFDVQNNHVDGTCSIFQSGAQQFSQTG